MLNAASVEADVLLVVDPEAQGAAQIPVTAATGDPAAPLAEHNSQERQETSQHATMNASFSITSKSTPSVILKAIHSSNSTSVMSISSNVYTFAFAAPAASELLSTLRNYDLPDKIYREAHYSTESDASDTPREYAGLLFDIRGGTGIGSLEEWDTRVLGGSPIVNINAGKNKHKGICKDREIRWSGWEYASNPPSFRQVCAWLTASAGKRPGGSRAPLNRSQVWVKLRQTF